MNLEQFEENVINWSTIRGIYENLDWQSQLKLFYDESLEAQLASNEIDHKLELGDMLVCLINCKHMYEKHTELFGMVGSRHSALEKGIATRNFSQAIKGMISQIRYSYNSGDVMQLTWNKIKTRKGLIVGDKWVKFESLSKANQKECIKRGM